MRRITREEVESAWDELCDMDQQESEKSVASFMEEQPALGMILYANEDDPEDQTTDSRSIEIVLTAWTAFKAAAGRPLKSITPEQIDLIEEANTEALMKLESASEMEFQAFAQGTLGNHNQPDLVGFAVEVLMSGHEENPDLAPESIGSQLLTIKTAIDSLDQHG